MTLEEAIKHAEEVADSHDKIKQIKAVTLEECRCAEEHRQLAEWLKDYKRLLELKTGHWIPVSKMLPNKPNVYIVTDSKGDVVRFVFNDTESSREYWLRCAKAWMPLPKRYEPQESEEV